MIEIVSWTSLFAVIFMLILSVCRQFTRLGRRGQIADSFGILSQWKFFALSSIKMRDDSFDDFHLLARRTDSKGKAGSWQVIFGNEDRKWFHFLWNPYFRAQGEIQMRMIDVANNVEAAKIEQYQTSLSYLTVLRHCLDCIGLLDGQVLQFVIISTRGNDARPVSAKFLSAWHKA